MQSQPVFESSRARLAGTPVAWAFGRGGGRFIHQGTVSGATLALQLETKALTVRADVPWPERAAMLGSLVATKDAPVLLGRLPPSAFAVLRYTGDAAALGDFWTWLVGARVTRAMQQAGVDVKQEILGQPEAGTGGLALAGAHRPDDRPARAGRAAHQSLLLRALHPRRRHARSGADRPVSSRSSRRSRRAWARAPTSAELAGQKVWLTRYAAGRGGARGAGGQLRDPGLSRALAGRLPSPGCRESPGTSPLAAELQPVLEGHALAVVVDLHALAAEVRALPEEAWGIGGFALKPTTVRWLDALKELRAVTATLDARDQALQADVTLRLKVEGT